MIDLSFFSVPRLWLRLGRLAHVLHHPRAGYVYRAFLSAGGAQAIADVYGNYFSRAVAAQHGAVAGERRAHRSHRRALSVDLGMLILMTAFLIGANLGADTHWVWPAILLALTGVGSAFFNTPSQAVMIGSLPKEHWGTAIGIINGIFGLGTCLAFRSAAFF